MQIARVSLKGHLDNGSFATIECSACNSGTASHTNQSNTAMLEELLSGFQRGLANERYQVIDTEICVDGLVELANSFSSNFTSAWVRVRGSGAPAGPTAKACERRV